MIASSVVRASVPTKVVGLQKQAVVVPGATAFAVRPNPLNGEAQALVVCHLGVCPLNLNQRHGAAQLEPPLQLRNHIASSFSSRRIHDAAYDALSDQVIFALSSSLYGMDSDNRLNWLAGDDHETMLLHDGPAADARFVGAQRLATDGTGVTFIRDRDSSSKNGFSLRALIEAPQASGHGGSGARAVVTVQIGGDTGPHALTYDSRRGSLLFAKRGRAVHQLHPHGVTTELIGTDEYPRYNPESASAAAAASSASYASESSDSDTASPVDQYRIFTNIQALAADGSSGNVYILDGTTGSTTALRVLRPDGALDTLEPALRVGPPGSSRWPRLAALPYGYLAVYGTSTHDILVLKP